MDADETYCGHLDDFREWAEARGIGFKPAMVMAIKRMMRDTEALGDMDLQTETLSAEAETLELMPAGTPRAMNVRLARKLLRPPKPPKPAGPGRGAAINPEITTKVNEARRLLTSGVPVYQAWGPAGFRTMQAMYAAFKARGLETPAKYVKS